MAKYALVFTFIARGVLINIVFICAAPLNSWNFGQTTWVDLKNGFSVDRLCLQKRRLISIWFYFFIWYAEAPWMKWIRFLLHFLWILKQVPCSPFKRLISLFFFPVSGGHVCYKLWCYDAQVLESKSYACDCSHRFKWCMQ